MSVHDLVQLLYQKQEQQGGVDVKALLKAASREGRIGLPLIMMK